MIKRSLINGSVISIALMALLFLGCPDPFDGNDDRGKTDLLTYSISGTITVEDAADLSEASVQLWYDGEEIGVAVTPDENGEFTITGVEKGEYHLTVTMDGYATYKSETIVVDDADITDIAIEMVKLPPDPADKSELVAAIDAAQVLIDTAIVHTDGIGLFETEKWVLQADRDDLENAIADADAVNADEAVLQDTVDTAVSALNVAMATFSAAIKNGLGFAAKPVSIVRIGEATLVLTFDRPVVYATQPEFKISQVMGFVTLDSTHFVISPETASDDGVTEMTVVATLGSSMPGVEDYLNITYSDDVILDAENGFAISPFRSANVKEGETKTEFFPVK